MLVLRRFVASATSWIVLGVFVNLHDAYTQALRITGILLPLPIFLAKVFL